jgi:hypothetical protein
VVFSDGSKAKQFSGVALEDVRSLTAKSIKMMYSFKKVVIVGEFNKIQSAIVELNKSANINSIHVV